MKTSVAMCTYNGARFIVEQLLSILHQTMHVDEIVICDDGSTDETLDIIEEIQHQTSIRFIIIKNKTNFGFFRNFLQVISLCTGDIIFLSDQDDVWQSDKVEKIVNWFDVYKEKDVIFTDAQLIDDKSELISSSTLWDRVGFDSHMQRYFDNGYGQEIFTIANRATGATMALRKNFLVGKDFLLYNMSEHDYCIAYLAASENRLGYLTEPLISYRLHADNAIGVEAYQLCCYSPLRACSLEIGNVHNLSEKATMRLVFIRKREQWYNIHHFAAITVCLNVCEYVHIYGKWWYRFLGYDLFKCLKNGFRHSA